MWLMTIYGFFSATSAKRADGRVDPARIQVRARVREHLENLHARFPHLRRYAIQESHNTDYAYRIILGRKSWTRVVATMVEETEWTNFKSAVASSYWTEAKYCHALASVWGVMYRLQPARQSGWFDEYYEDDMNEKKVIGASVSAEARGAAAGNRPKPAPIVEDVSVVGGIDEASGAPTIRPRAADGLAEGGQRATDPRERR